MVSDNTAVTAAAACPAAVAAYIRSSSPGICSRPCNLFFQRTALCQIHGEDDDPEEQRPDEPAPRPGAGNPIQQTRLYADGLCIEKHPDRSTENHHPYIVHDILLLMKTFSYYSIKAGPYFSEPLYRPG